MKIREKITLESSIKWFAALCTASLLFASVPFIHFLYQPIMLLSVVFGAGLLLWIFLLDRRVYRHPFFPVFFLFCVSYFVTILLNRQSGFFSNCGQLVYTDFYFFIFFCVFSSLGSEARSAVLKLICQLVFVFSMAAALISLGMMLASYSAEIPYQGTTITIGFHQRNSGMQLAGITSGPSSLSQLCLLGIFSAWYLFGRKEVRRSGLCVVICVIYLFTIGAANAYSALIAMLAFSVLFPLCRGIGGPAKKKAARRGTEAAAQMLALCLFVTGAFYGTQRLETFAVNGISQAVYQHELKEEEKNQPSTSEQPKDEDQERPDEPEIPGGQPSTPEQPEDDGQECPDEPEIPGDQPTIPEQPPEPPKEVMISRDIKTSANGSRSAIWKEGVKLFLAHPLGVTNNGISVKIFYGVPDYEYRNLHNGYLTLLAASGIIGFALILVFGVWFFIKALRGLSTCHDEVKGRLLSVLIASCGAILAGDLVNGCFVLWRGLPYIFLWLLLGEICAWITELSPEKK